jgi:hypothetical protein
MLSLGDASQVAGTEKLDIKKAGNAKYQKYEKY